MASPQYQALIAALNQPMFPPGDTLEQARQKLEAVHGHPVAPTTRVERVTLAGVPCSRVTVPEAEGSDATLLLCHGGAFVAAGGDGYLFYAEMLGRPCRARVLLVDYRLAPEHAFPAAVDDALSTWRFLLDAGIAPESVAIAGDSAGGGLTAATLVAVRDSGAPLPAAAVCISPWLDLTLSGGTIATKADEDPFVDALGLLAPAAEAYLAGADPKTPTASPLFADLAGLPPLLVQVGTAEILLDDARSFAERARLAGVDVELEVAQDMIHVWHAFADIFPEGAQAIDRLTTFLQKHLP